MNPDAPLPGPGPHPDQVAADAADLEAVKAQALRDRMLAALAFVSTWAVVGLTIAVFVAVTR